MVKEELRSREPIAYRSLYNALKNRRVAHSYLFSGEYSPLKIEAAYLLAQSIIEGKDDFACEVCPTCRRIRRNEYFDVIFVDGYHKLIKKEDIESIMDEFSRTSLEAAGKKIYILANINNASLKVLNMILKFMEEPSSSSTYGIFICDNKEELLPTVVSRCQDVSFLTRDFSDLAADYEKAGFERTDAYLLANILHTYDQSFDLNDVHYLTAKEFVFRTIDSLTDPDHLPVLFSQEFYPSFKDRDDFKKCTDHYFKIMLRMLEDALGSEMSSDEGYDAYLAKLSASSPAGLLKIFKEAYERTVYPVDRRLLFDGICREIISYIRR